MNGSNEQSLDSNATNFAKTREAVAQHEEGKIDTKFAIGDALLVEIGVPGTRAAETQSKLKRCSEYLQDLGYSYEVKTLDAIRRVAHAYPADERGDLLHSMRRPTWATLEVAAKDPSILDDMVAVMEGGKPSLRLPDMVIISLRKRKLIRVQDVRDTFKHLDSIEKRAYDVSVPNPPVEIIDLRGDDEIEEDEDERDAGELHFNITDSPELRKEREKFKGDTSQLGKQARKSYSLPEARALAEEDAAKVQGSAETGFTYVVHQAGEEPEVPAVAVGHMLVVLEESKRGLYEFLRLWSEAGMTINQAIEVYEKLDEIRAVWELAHQLINGQEMEMH